MILSPLVFQIDTASPVPLYHQIKENLRQLIDDEILTSGSVLPSERELARFYHVNRITVRRALSDLVHEGMLVRQHGVGTFVATSEPFLIQPALLSFTQRMRQLGHEASSQVILLEIQPSSDRIARHLEIQLETPIVTLQRLHLADNEPLMLETSHLVADRFGELIAEDLGCQSLYGILKSRFGVVVAHIEQTLEPVILTDYEAELLQAGRGTPAMLAELLASDVDGHPIEFCKSIVRGDKSRFYFHEYRRDLVAR